MAKQANISKRTLHYYEQIGLLQPARVAGNGYRYYDENAVLRLQKILLLKSIGYTLEPIKTLLLQETAAQENEQWIASLNEQIAFIEQKKEELSRKQYYLRSTVHSIRLKGTCDFNDLLRVIADMNDRPLVAGIVPAEFGEDLPLTAAERDILNRLPVIGSEDKRLEELLLICEKVRSLMPLSPDSPEVQRLAGQLYEQALALFEGDAHLLDKYWALVMPAPDADPVVMGMDRAFMAYIDEMMSIFLQQREGEQDE